MGPGIEVYAKAARSSNIYDYSLMLNDQHTKYLDLSFILAGSKITLKTLNPLFPFSFTTIYGSDENGAKVEGEFCWDVENPQTNTIAAALTLRTDELKLKVHHPKKMIEIHGTYQQKSDSIKTSIKCTLDDLKPVGYEIKLKRESKDNLYNVVGKLFTPYDRYLLKGEANLDDTFTYGTAKVDYEQTAFNYKTTISCFENEMKMTAESSVFGREMIYSLKHKLNKGNTLFYGKQFIQLPFNRLGSFTNELEVTSNKHESGKQYMVVYRGEGSRLYDAEATFEVIHADDEVSAHINLEAFNFFGKPYTYNFMGKYEDNGATKTVRISSPNLMLLEGTFQSMESGYKTGIKGSRMNKEFLNSSLVVDRDPGYIQFSAGPRQDNQLVNIRADMSDLLSARLYVQPQIVNYAYALAY